jgi:hypothetical protein
MSWIFVTLLIVSLVAADAGGCDFGDPVPRDVFNNLIRKMSSRPFSSEKLAMLADWAKNNTLGLTSNQTLVILNQFTMSDDRVAAVKAVSKFILTLECKDFVSVLSTVGFSSDKMKLLRLLINLANQADLKVNNASILRLWTMSNDIREAKDIIEKSKPRSCLFGPADIPLFSFIIDVSGSMDEKFRDKDGVVYSRLSYVQKDLLSVMNGTLQPSQQFNIIQFAYTAGAWQPGIVPASPANIASASNYVRGLRAGGGTYVLNALKYAFQDTKVLGVYFLSDGEPQDGIPAIMQFANATKKPINTIAFKAPQKGQQFLLQLATATRGTFRNIIP